MTRFCLLPLSAVLLLAGDAAWKSKPISEWNADDAKQVLTSSPWVKKAAVSVLPQRSEAQMRDGGQMGMTKGAGLGVLGPSMLTGLGGASALSRNPQNVSCCRSVGKAPLRSAARN